MYTFLLLAIPCTLLFFLNSPLAADKGQANGRRSYWMAFCLGFFPALAYCIIDEFFIFSSFRFTDSLPSAYVHLLLKDSLIPTALLCGPYLLLSRREPEDRSFALLTVLAAFYMAYLPYCVITGEERNSQFLSFVKPLLICSHIAIFPLCCRGISACAKSGNKAALAAFGAGLLISPALPPLAEALWHLQRSTWTYVAITAFMLASLVLLTFFMCKMASKTLDKSI